MIYLSKGGACANLDHIWIRPYKNMADLKLAIFCEKQVKKNSKFRYKSSEYQNFSGFFAYTKGKW